MKSSNRSRLPSSAARAIRFGILSIAFMMPLSPAFAAPTCPNFSGSYKIVKASTESTSVSIQQTQCGLLMVQWFEGDGTKLERKYILDDKEHAETDAQGTRVVTIAKATESTIEYHTSYYEASTQALRFTIAGRFESKNGSLTETQIYTTEQNAMTLTYGYTPKN